MLRSEMRSVQSAFSLKERMFCEPRGQSPVVTNTTGSLVSPVPSAFYMSMPLFPPTRDQRCKVCRNQEEHVHLLCGRRVCHHVSAEAMPGFVVGGRRLPVSAFPCRDVCNRGHVTLHLWALGLLFLSEMERSKTSSSGLTDL